MNAMIRRTFRTEADALLSPAEQRTLRSLRTPEHIQDYVESLPVNFEPDGNTNFSPRRVLRQRAAHCIEAALFAAAALGYHGWQPLLMDLQAGPYDEDHVVAPFKRGGYWGAISKSNHAVLRWRDPVYRSPRELAMSYFHEYFENDGRKSMRSYSAPFSLRRYPASRWLVAEEHLDWLAEDLDASRHFPVAPAARLRTLRRASDFERRVMAALERPRAARIRDTHQR